LPDIELFQYDSDDVPVVLFDNGSPVNLAGSDVNFVMTQDQQRYSYTIKCKMGATIDGNIIPYTAGGITINFSEMETSHDGLFFCYFKVSKFGKFITYPTVGYVTTKIKKKL